MPIETVDIVEILGRAEQGKTRPFICRGDDGHSYFVKGRGASLRSLICELVCGQLAQAFGLPVAEFAVAEVPDALILPVVRPDIRELGVGPGFGSRALPHVQEFALSHELVVDAQLGRDLLVFDWWVRNADRTLSSHGGNPNLLWDCEADALVVIDHNQAFDPDFDAGVFMETHVFREFGRRISEDWVEREAYALRLEGALASYDQACDNVPPDWWYVDDGVPADFDRALVRAMLERFRQNDFWRMG